MKRGFRQNHGYRRSGQGRGRGRKDQWHPRQNRTGVYRSRQGIIMGVCSGLADHFDISVFWIRLACLVLLFFSGLWPMIGIYIIASFIMKPKPIKPLETEGEKDFYDNYVNSREGAIRTLKARFEALERRIRRMEESIIDREFEWDRKFNA